MISIYDTTGLEELRRRNAVQPHRMKCFFNALFKQGRDLHEAISTLPEGARVDFENHVQEQSIRHIDRLDSKIDGASKLVFRTADDQLIESVILRPSTGRTSLCISSQVGCGCACRFCATGKMGFSRNLTCAEMLDQIVQAARILKAEGRTIRNVVFMGMGEPLLNYEELSSAIRLLRDRRFFNFPGAKLMVSTVGIVPMIQRFSHEFPEVRLAVSLHSARQHIREELMPIAAAHPLDQLRTVLQSVVLDGKIMIEYLMLEGVNDGDADFVALEKYLRGLSVHINIIPFNAFEGCNLNGSARSVREAFADRLKAAGFETTLRYSLGADIEAACGQLVKKRGSE